MELSGALPEFSAGLVAGGESSRMGRDKAEVLIDGIALWRRQVATLQALAPMEIVISGRPGGDYAASGLPVVFDAVAKAGPLAGIAALLDRAQTPFLLVLAVDMPFMTSGYLQTLLPQNRAAAGKAPRIGGVYEGLAALFPKAALPLAQAALQSGDRSLQRFVRECVNRGLMETVAVEEADRLLFHSVNTPGDLPG